MQLLYPKYHNLMCKMYMVWVKVDRSIRLEKAIVLKFVLIKKTRPPFLQQDTARKKSYLKSLYKTFGIFIMTFEMSK